MNQNLHPILAQMSPSAEQLGPILSRGEDVAVTAGAGTGKTRTLVARYLSLLADGVPLRSILAITFTKKAAREMRNRIREEVRSYLGSPHTPLEEREVWREIYDQLDAARISTIHTLCGEILRHHPAESGVDPDFRTIEEDEMTLYQAQAVDRALGWAIDDPETVILFSDFDAGKLRGILRRLLEKRLDVVEAKSLGCDNLWQQWQDVILDPIRSFVNDPDVQDRFHTLGELKKKGILQKAEAAGDQLVPDLRRALKLWERIQTAASDGDWARVSRHLAPLRDSLKQKGRQDNWSPARPKDIIQELQNIYDQELASLVQDGLDVGLDQDLAEEIVPALWRLFEQANGYYGTIKEREHALDFDDLEWKAVRLLEEHPDIRAFWQSRLNAVLVDEYQDTNGRQRDLLNMISGDDGKLFIVGDAKQSIYRFRGADVAVFREEERKIRRAGEGYHLATSYRAHRSLIHDLNELLAPVLGEAQPDKTFVSPFEPLAPHREQPVSGVDAPYVEFHLTVGSKADGALERAAEVAVNRLIALVEGDAISATPESGHDSGLDYGDIAILCRASNSFQAYENALEAAGIPYITIAGRGFYERPEVRDVLHALRALDHPFEDLAVAGLLRSPVHGLSDLALYRLRETQRRREISSLYRVLAEDDLTFLGTEEVQARRVKRLFDALHNVVGRVPVAHLIKSYLERTNYLSALQRAGQNRGRNNLKKLLADAYQGGMISVGRFLDYVEDLRGVSVREGEAQTLAAGAVQIMTVHQAKGLEFPVVVLGDLSRGMPNIKDVIIDERLGIVPPLNREELVEDGKHSALSQMGSAAYRLAEEREKEEQRAEEDRLLYVAATRAKDQLILSGVLGGIKKDGTPYSLDGWLSKLGEPLGLEDVRIPYDETGSQIHGFQLGDSDHNFSCAIYEPGAVRGLESQRTSGQPTRDFPSELPSLEPLPDEKKREETAEEERERQVWRVVSRQGFPRAPAWLVGRIVHMALAQWWFPDQNGGNFKAWIVREAENSGLTNQEAIRDAVRQTTRMMKTFQRTELYQAMDQSDRRYHEIPYSLESGSKEYQQGMIDALFLDQGKWVLVEFKTDRIRDKGNIDRLLKDEDYIEQVSHYLAAAERYLEERPSPVLCFLNIQNKVKLIRDLWQ